MPVRNALGDKSLLPDLQADAYLSYAAIAPATTHTRAAANQVLTDYAERGQIAFLRWAEQRERLRGKLGRLLNVPARHIALTSSATRGITDLALSLAWKPGDRVLLNLGDFPGNVSPWQNVAELFSLEVRFLPKQDPHADEGQFLAALEAELQQGVRLVALSAVQFQTGLRTPLEAASALCHKYGAELGVDAIQAAGIVPLDVQALDLDYVAGGAHKWLMALEGTGYLYAKPERIAQLKPRTAGWLSHEGGVGFLSQGPGELRYDRPIKTEIQFLEGSSSNVLGFAALEAALDPILEIGVEAIFDHVDAYLVALDAGLAERGIRSLRAREQRRRSGILSFTPPRNLKALDLVHALRSHRIFATMPDGLVRLAPHFPNSPAEIPQVLAALDASLSTLCA